LTAAYERIIAYIDGHIDEEITLGDLSRLIGYSERQVQRLFRLHGGTSVTEYIRKRRISAAANDLRSGRNFQEIALDYGYVTPAGFYKAFRGVYGCSPSDYKNNLLRRKDSMATENEKTFEEINRQLAELYIEREIIHAEAKRFDEAAMDFTRAIELDPTDAEAYRNRGMISGGLRTLEEVIKDYTKSIEFDSDFPITYRYRADAYRQLGKLENAIEDLDVTIKMASDGWTSYLNRGLNYLELKHYDKAEEDFTKVIELAPDLMFGYANRALLYEEMNRHGEAVGDFKKAEELNEVNFNPSKEKLYFYTLPEFFLARKKKTRKYRFLFRS